MRFLTVAERELRTAARKRSTYLIRWLTATGFFLLLVWVMWASDALKYQGRAHEAFTIFSVMVFIYCLIVGAVRTADCLSSERREGTLGLLFLTNLNGFEIIVGKLCANAVSTVYALLSIIPMLALPLLMGGTTFEHFTRAVLALLNTIYFSLAVGFVASVLCKRQFTAVALALALALIFGMGSFGAAAIVHELRGPRGSVDVLSAICPLYSLAAAEGRIFGSNHFWPSLITVACLSTTLLGLVVWQLSRSWRDRPKTVRASRQAGSATPTPKLASTRRTAFRRRLLDINPFFWLSGRRLVSAPIFMCVIVALVLIADYVAAPFFTAKISGPAAVSPLISTLFAWLFTCLGIHVLVLYYAAMISAQRLAEDKEAGALELILSTPATERLISRGLWMGFARRMLFPALAAILVHIFFLWKCLVMAVAQPPGQFLPYSTTPSEIFWAIILGEPVRGRALEWEFIFVAQLTMIALAMLIMVWFTLAIVARWLGLRMKHPGFAPIVSLALVFVPPILLFSLVCFAIDQLGLNRLPPQQFLPLLKWLAVGIGVTHCLLLYAWASRRLTENFRDTVIGRFEEKRRWLPRGRTVMRVGLRLAIFVGAMALITTGFYACQNYRGQRAWNAFQLKLKKQQQSLDLAPLLPAVPDGANFAQAPAFVDLVQRKSSVRDLLDSFSALDTPVNLSAPNGATLEWMNHNSAPLGEFCQLVDSNSKANQSSDNSKAAPVLLTSLQRFDGLLTSISAAAAQRSSFQVTTNHDAYAVLQPKLSDLKIIEGLQFLFIARASARLEVGQIDGAKDDLVTSLRLARIAGRSPDGLSLKREQIMLIRSFQPLWEGLWRHQWSDPHLVAVQSELNRFNLIIDYTNAVNRIVLANIDVWRKIPESKPTNVLPPSQNARLPYDRDWRTQSKTWWYYNCIQLYDIGLRLMERADVKGEHIWIDMRWDQLSNLPLDNEEQMFLNQYEWQGDKSMLVSFGQTTLNQAKIACALERFRLSEGRYPANLEQLLPRWLDRIPNDVARGRPLTYEPLAEGSYALRAFGFNRVNDRTNSASDDWLWTYPTNAPAAVQSP